MFQGDTMISVITDILILILPIPMAWRMQAPRWQKVKIVFLLGAGGAATLTTVVRSWLNVQFMHTKSRSSTDAYIAFFITHLRVTEYPPLTTIAIATDVTLDFALPSVTS